MSIRKTDKIQKMTFTLLICLIYLVAWHMPALASSVDAAQVRSAPLVADNITRNGMVRVYLSSLGNPTSLDLTVNGNYSLSHNGEFLANGSRMTVNFSPTSGNITLSYNGQTVSMGKRFSLRRHSAAGSNGILIAQSRDSQNPYPGDLSFEAVSNGNGYTLYTIAHVYIENYLYGVLPYEMGNSSGSEALKAQAVAARTYTVRMMEKRASSRYDVKDTTSDQVYRGTPSGNANCVAAVDATKGIVLMHGSEYITTYYSASNGGQTETARTGTAYAYMKVKDDPFDYANPNATVKRKTIYTDLTSSANPAQLISLLKTKAVARLQRSGYSATAENTTLGILKSVTPHTPMYDSPSRLYTQMDFTFTVSTQNAAGQTTVVTLTETCGIFTELESMLGMGIQSMQNELWSVEKGDTTFVLQARRYGHGMGMSQRGAMYMDKLGYTYDQILGFYYDGCKRVRHSFTNSILDASSSDQQITVEPPADLGESSVNSCIGTVVLADNGSSLAIRAAADASSAIISTAGNGTMVEVLVEEGTWYQIRLGEIVGYVPASALSVTGTPSGQQQQSTNVAGFGTVKAKDFVNLRASGSMNAKVLGTAPTGAVMTVISSSGSWAKVQYNTLTAYVNINYISAITSDYPSDKLSNGSRTAKVVTEDGTGTVNLRKSPSTGSQLVDRLEVDTVVTVYSDDGSWCHISSPVGDGYMLAEFLKYIDEAENAPPSEESEDTKNDPASAARAIVVTESGSLNMRSTPKAGSRIVTTIPRGAEVSISAYGDVWSAVRYGSYEGYVMTRYLSVMDDVPETPSQSDEPTNVLTAMVVTPSGTLNLRSSPWTGSQILERIPPYTMLNVLEQGADWCNVEYLGTTGYVMSSFLSFDQKEKSPDLGDATEQPDGNDGSQSSIPSKAIVNTQSGSLNLRLQPSITSGVLTAIPQYTEVTITAYGDEWSAVRYGSYEGYVMTRYLRLQGQAEQAPEKEQTNNEPSGSNDAAPLFAWVKTSGGSLNLRSAANGNSNVLTTIPQNAQVTLLASGDEWSSVSYDGYSGFVMTRFLSASKPAVEDESQKSEQPPVEEDSAEKTADPFVTIGGIVLDVTLQVPASATFASPKEYLTVYSMCDENEEVLFTVPQGDIVEIILTGESWSLIAYQEEQGYCLTDELSVIKE